jgi:hypothetical protein
VVLGGGGEDLAEEEVVGDGQIGSLCVSHL